MPPGVRETWDYTGAQWIVIYKYFLMYYTYMMRPLYFDVVDIDVKLVRKSLPVERAKQLTDAELKGNYFDASVCRPDSIYLRYADKHGIIGIDGRIRLVARKTTLEDAFNAFKILIGIAKKLEYFDESEEIFDYDNVLIMHFPSKKGAINKITEFIGKDKVEKISKVVGERVAAPYFGFYLREIGNLRKELIDIDIEPSIEDINKYRIQVIYRAKECKGIKDILPSFNDIIEKVIKVITYLEGEKE
ncbi:MAG: hypothetical protein DRJ03_23295 [Chloroflexi bacterium]|nr:MAG: hypothetical protein DRJ03_23295 [Chloroflexota bacterium]